VLSTFERIETATGGRPKGWLSSGLQESWHTLDYLVEAGATYVADWINDDQPYLMNIGGKRLCSIPYSGEINDLPQILRAGRSSDEFAGMIRRQFDTLYREGAQSGRVMAIALHPYLTGVPHRIDALDAALAYIGNHVRVWKATGAEIARHYRAQIAKQ
jgi:allantoinase